MNSSTYLEYSRFLIVKKTEKALYLYVCVYYTSLSLDHRVTMSFVIKHLLSCILSQVMSLVCVGCLLAICHRVCLHSAVGMLIVYIHTDDLVIATDPV